MDLDALRVFVKVAELASFTRAGEQLGVSRSRTSLRVRALEDDLGCTLFQRSTRVVRLTADGEALLARARRLLDECDEIEAMFHPPSGLRGLVRVDLPVNFAREVVIPRLPELLAAHPRLEVFVSTTDRRVDVLREGFDCVLRVGALDDSSLVARRLGMLPMVNCASPAYLRRHGVPLSLDDLDAHLVVHYATGRAGETPTFEHVDDGRTRERPMRSAVTVNSADAYRAACLAGLGIIQAPRTGMLGALAAGDLVEVLARHVCAPMPVSIVHAHGARVPRRVRAVMNWLAQSMSPHLA